MSSGSSSERTLLEFLLPSGLDANLGIVAGSYRMATAVLRLLDRWCFAQKMGQTPCHMGLA